MNFAIACFLLFLMTGWPEPTPKVKQALPGKEFTLKVGEQVLIKKTGLKISFSSVAEDSRCPKGVDCIWAGNGKIVVKIIKGRRVAAEFQLNTGIEPKQHHFHGYDIELVSLNPYPHKDVPIKRGAYIATLVVNKVNP